jgi:hypothetical protein
VVTLTATLYFRGPWLVDCASITTTGRPQSVNILSPLHELLQNHGYRMIDLELSSTPGVKGIWNMRRATTLRGVKVHGLPNCLYVFLELRAPPDGIPRMPVAKVQTGMSARQVTARQGYLGGSADRISVAG